MTRADLKRLIRNLVGNHPYVTDINLNDYINLGVRDVAKIVRAWDDYAYFYATAGQREYNLPDNLLRLSDDVSYEGNPCREISLQEAQDLYGNFWGAILNAPVGLQGMPDRFYSRRVSTGLDVTVPGSGAISNSNLLVTTQSNPAVAVSVAGRFVMGFYVTPNGNGRVDYFGTFVPGDLVNDTDSLPWPTPYQNCIMFYGAWMAWLQLREFVTAEQFRKEFEKQKMEFYHDIKQEKPEYVLQGIPDMTN